MKAVIEFLKKFDRFLVGIVALIIAIYVSESFMSHNKALQGINPHPYIIVCVLLSSIYGLSFSFLISLAFSGLYLYYLDQQVDYQAVDTLFQFEYLIIPFFNFVTSIIVGDVRERSLRRERGSSGTLRDKEKIVTKLKDQNLFLNKQNIQLKKQLVSKLETTDSIYKNIKNLASYDIDKIQKNFLKIINQQAKVQTAGIYLFSEPSTPNLLIKQDSIVDPNFPLEELPDSIDIKNSEIALIDKTIQTLKTATVKEIFNREAFTHYQNSPLLCTPIIEEEELKGIVAVYQMPFLEYIPHNFKLIKLYTDWLSHSFVNAELFNKLSANALTHERLGLYKYQYFKERTLKELNRSERLEVPTNVIDFELIDQSGERLSNDDLSFQVFSKLINETFTDADCIALSKSQEKILVLEALAHKDKPEQDIERLGKEIEKINEHLKDENRLTFKSQVHGYQAKTGNRESFIGQLEHI